MAAIKPACTGEPVTARINHGKASVETCDPMADTICPLHSSKKSRCRHNEAGRATAVGLPGFSVLCTSGDGFCDRVMVRYFRSMQHRSFLSLLYLFFGQVSPTQNFVLPGLIYNRNLFIIVGKANAFLRSEEHTSELQSRQYL